jgi:GT2 family glycosyltransferase
MNNQPSTGDKMYPLVHFVIINWNQPELTLACLESLSNLNYSPFQIVLVDNGSTDDSVALIRQNYPDVILIETGENLGYSAGNNVGIRYAMGHGAEYVFLLNNDTAIDKEMLLRMVAASEADPEVGMVGPTIYYFDPPNMLWSAVNSIRWPQGQIIRHGMNEAHPKVADDAPAQEVDYVDSCAVLVKREVIEKVGMLDEAFFINYDDADWNIRARQAGFKIVYVPTACLWHKVSAAMGQASPATTYYMTRNSLLFFWRHSRGLTRLKAVMYVIGRTVRTIAAWTLKRQYSHQNFRRKRNANLYALRDALLGRFGPMGADVRRACFGK